ncbi:15259_t:CDS:2 [Rhizophagus irregularis]|nr:15259_t:CDS:2 [Rhizophagus irregularis]
MSDIECNEEFSLFDFKLGNSVGQNRSNKSPYFHFVFGEEYDKSINFSKPASIKLDKNEETIQISFETSENEPSYSLSGQRFEDNTDEMDVEDAEKNYLLIFDEVTKTYTLECLDYEFHIASYSDAELERELESRLMQKEIDEEDQLYTLNGDDYVDEEEDDEFEEKFREVMEIEDDMYGPIEDEDVTKDDISGSSNSSSSGISSSSSSDSDNSGDDGSDSSESELESEFGDIEAQMKQSMNSVAKSPRTKRDLNTAGGKRSNGDGNPISLAALLGGAEEQDQDDSTDDSD